MISVGNSLFRRIDLKKRRVALYLIAALLFSCEKSPSLLRPVEYTGFTLGTTYSIKLSRMEVREYSRKLHDELNRCLSSVEVQMSVFNKASEISRFNVFRRSVPFGLSDETFKVLLEARRVSVVSNGAFDITVAPLVDAWGFGESGRRERVPKPEKIEALLPLVDFNAISLSSPPPAIRKRRPGIRLNLSAIAKGFAVDKIARLLEGKGMKNYLIEVGGEIQTKGEKNKGRPWILAVEKPNTTQRSIQRVLSIGNNSMATSGDYRNFFEMDGKRYSHIINPKTGWPIASKLSSVSVVHPSCMTADAFATALMVLGVEDGYKLAVREKLAVFFISTEKDGLREKMTPQFKSYLIKRED